MKPRQDVTVQVIKDDGREFSFTARCRIDTYNELEYFKSGGILHYVLGGKPLASRRPGSHDAKFDSGRSRALGAPPTTSQLILLRLPGGYTRAARAATAIGGLAWMKGAPFAYSQRAGGT